MNFNWMQHIEIDTIIDVGANVGQWSIRARQLWPNARIYAFEPLENDHEILSETFKDDKLFNSYKYAVSDVDDKIVDFNLSSFSQSSSLLEMGDVHKTEWPFTAQNNKIKVKTITIDELVRRGSIVLEEVGQDGSAAHKNLLFKMDVQGAELKVIAGANKTIEKTKVLFIETSFVELYKGQPLFFDILKVMDEKGFMYAGNCYGTLNSARTGFPLEEDSIFIRNDLKEVLW